MNQSVLGITRRVNGVAVFTQADLKQSPHTRLIFNDKDICHISAYFYSGLFLTNHYGKLNSKASPMARRAHKLERPSVSIDNFGYDCQSQPNSGFLCRYKGIENLFFHVRRDSWTA